MRADEHEQMWDQAYPTTAAQVIAVLTMLLIAVLSVVCAPILLLWLLAGKIFTVVRVSPRNKTKMPNQISVCEHPIFHS